MHIRATYSFYHDTAGDPVEIEMQDGYRGAVRKVQTRRAQAGEVYDVPEIIARVLIAQRGAKAVQA